MNASLYRAGGGRRIRPSTTVLLVCCALLVLLLCLAGPAAAYVPGKLVWSKTTGSAAHERGFDAIAKAPNGQFYGVGWVSTGGAKGEDILVVKYSASGKALWTRTWDGGGGAGTYDWANYAVSDAKGNLWVAGVGDGTSGSDIVTMKFNASGTRKWAQRWNGAIVGWHSPRGLALDGQGNCVVVGSVYRGPSILDVVAIKYDAGGNQQWVARYNQDDGDPADGPKWATGVAVNGAGDVYVSGGSRHDSLNQALVLKLAAADGALAQKAVYDAAAGSWAEAIAVRGQSVVLGGSAAQTESQEAALVVRYDLSLAEQARLEYQDPRGADSREFVNDVAIGSGGSIFAAGYSNFPPPGGSGFYDSALLLRWSGSGSAAWVKLYKPKGQGAEATLLILDASNNAYLGGYADTEASEENVLLAKYSASGTRKWAKSWHDTGKDDDSIGGLVLSGSKTLYVAGEGNAKGDFYRAVAMRIAL